MSEEISITAQRDRFAKELVSNAIWYSEDGEIGCQGCKGELNDAGEKKQDEGISEDEFKAVDIDHEEDCVVGEAYKLISTQSGKVCTCSNQPGRATLDCKVHGFSRG